MSITSASRSSVAFGRSLNARTAAEAAFALSIPSVYEDLVQMRRWSADTATRVMTDAISGTVVDPSTRPVVDPLADWSAVLEAPDVLAQAPSAGE